MAKKSGKELQQCRQELLAAHARVSTLKNELSMINSPAGILMKQKQQAEESLQVVHPPVVSPIIHKKQAQQSTHRQGRNFTSVL